MNVITVFITLLLSLSAMAVDCIAQTVDRSSPADGERKAKPGAVFYGNPDGQLVSSQMVKNSGNLYRQKPQPHHSHFPCCFPYNKSFFRGSYIQMYIGPGGYYVSETGVWGWHDRRKSGHIYYSHPVLNARFLIEQGNTSEADVNRGVATDNRSEKQFTPRSEMEVTCSKPPKIINNVDGSAYLYFTKTPEYCNR